MVCPKWYGQPFGWQYGNRYKKLYKRYGMNSKKYSNVSQRVPFHLKIIDAVYKIYLRRANGIVTID